MRLLISIAHFGNKNLRFLREIIEEYRKMKLPLSLHLAVSYSKIGTELPSYNFLFESVHPERTDDLTYVHRELFKSELKNFDYFLYSEDDIKISQESILFLMGLLREEFVFEGKRFLPGFLRFEEIERKIWLVDLFRKANSILGFINGFFFAFNPHSACYLLDKKRLGEMVEMDFWYPKALSQKIYKSPLQPLGIKPRACSEFYFDFFHQKIYPRKNFQKLLVEHLPKNWFYIHKGRVREIRLLSLEELRELVE